MADRDVHWPRAWRVIASRYPPIDLFEDLGLDPADWDALVAAEELVNPRVREATGNLALVPDADRIHGPGASYVMASFTHVNRQGSRFSDGSYGVYYAASSLDGAIAETIHHFERIAADSGDAQRLEQFRVLVGTIGATVTDVGAEPDPLRSALLDPASYVASRPYARARRDAGANGIVFPSVRLPTAECVAMFRPRSVGAPVQERHLAYHYDGERVDQYFDYRADAWVNRPS